MRMRRLLPVALVAPAVALAGWPSGSEINPSVLVDLTKDGLNALAQVLPALLPEEIYIGDMTVAEGEVDLWLWTYKYGAYVYNLWIGVEVQSVTLTPGADKLDLAAHVNLWVNDSADPFVILAKDNLFGNVVDCDTYTDPFNVWATGDIGLDVIDDGINPPYLDATVGPIAVTWDAGGEDFHFGDCWIGDIDGFFDYLGWSPIDAAIDLALDFAEGEIQSQLDEMRPELEQTIEEAFGAATIEQEVEVNGSIIKIAVHPSDVEIVPAGVRVSAAGSFDSLTHPCVAEYGHLESLETPSDIPAIASAPSSIPTPHHLGALIADDFGNQGLFAAYNAGVLCYTMTADSGLPINTSLLNILHKETFQPLFPETKPVIIQTRPAQVPVLNPDGKHDINLEVRELGVDFMAELDYRNALMLGADLDIDAGVDLAFDDALGNLDIQVALGAEDLRTTIRHNEFAVGHDQAIAGSFQGLFDTIVGPLLGGITEGLAFGLPSMEGLGITSLEVAASGPGKDYVGVYANIGEVDYANDAGCGSDGGGCDTGCGTGAIPVRTVLFAFPLLLAFVRRRRSA